MIFLIPPISEAHQDGCHRWHSCPSDSGSYVCGDLGYTNECPRTATYTKEINYSMSVHTDKKVYSEGEVILITINSDTLNTAVSIVMENMDGNFVQMGQGKLETDKTLNTQFTTGGNLMVEAGTYTIIVTAINNITANTMLEYEPSLKVQVANQISLEKIACFDGLELILKNNGDPVCVSHDTLVKLLERNWGTYSIIN